MRVWLAAHAVDDFYQGLIPASIPFFVVGRHYSYLAASGLALAAALGSSLPQPLFGLLADRRHLPWLAPVGLALAAAGAGLAGIAPGYPLVWALLLLSGLGVAAFHPAAGRGARRDARHSTTAMSLFAAGGSIGFFLAPALATPALVSLGLAGMALFVPPAVLMAFVLWRHEARRSAQPGEAQQRAGRDRWGPFAILTCVEVVRSVVFFGVNTFVGLYWIDCLGASKSLAGAALTCFLVGGVLGTLAGGRLGDRVGLARATRWGSVAAIPALAALRLVAEPHLALGCAVLAGVAVNIPFAVLVKLGQDYLPSRPGTASGVTLGLAVSIGGVFLPAFGAIANTYGPAAVFTVLCAVPAIALGLALWLPEPEHEEAS
nr:MFS transporter [Segniliparus rugosus]